MLEAVTVGDGVGVGVSVSVAVDVAVAVWVGVLVSVALSVMVGVGVLVAVGFTGTGVKRGVRLVESKTGSCSIGRVHATRSARIQPYPVPYRIRIQSSATSWATGSTTSPVNNSPIGR